MITDFRLKVFVEVAQRLSFSRAADELNISQPAVTKNIKELERMLSVTLFDRQARSISLIYEGEKLLPLAREILENYTKLCDSFEKEGHDYSGRLRVGSSSTITQYLLPSILARFNKKYPNIEVVLTNGNSEHIINQLLGSNIDIAIIEDAHNSVDLNYQTVVEDDIILVSSTRHKKPISIDQISTLPLILRENGSGTLNVIETILAKNSIFRRNLNVTMQIGSSEAIIRYLLSSNSYAFISRLAVKQHLRKERLFEVEIDGLTISREFRFATKHGYVSRLVECFRRFVTKNI